MFEKEKLYRPCWIKNSKINCFYSCFNVKKVDKILSEKKRNNKELKTIIMPCNYYLPEFIDKIKSQYKAQKKYEQIIL